MTSTAVTPPDSRAERVSGMDAWQLYQETRLQVGNGMSLILVDRSSVIGDLREYVVSALNNRMHLMPAYRKVLYDPWFNPDRPMLVARPEIDVSAHVTALPMPAPGGAVGAAKALAQVRAMHLNRREPLWHMYVLDDEDTERSYLISVVHHLLVDGDSTMEVVGCLMTPGDLSARPPKPIPASSTFPARPSAVVRDALARKGNRLRRLPRLVTTSARIARSKWAARHLDVKAPRTALNCSLSGSSTAAVAVLPIVDLQTVAEKHSVTINHVLLSCVGAALNEVLRRRGERPAEPLVAAVPYAMRAADTSDYVTDGVGTTTVLRVNLHTTVDDPVRRLLAVAEHARAVKAVQEQRGVNLFRQWNEYAPGRAVNLMFRAIERFGLAERISWPCNVIVSNASGIAVEDPVFLNLPALRFHPAGPLYHGMGPSVIAMTWDSNLCLSVTADTRHVADAAVITDGIAAEFAALLGSAG
ncbi:wax ester/triacylglycerol synthase domain-containing protein [Mycolicibacterium vaccae]|nr:wax ester/triacylglycerol synthase domain-containing protein [Mycolicibacterium vaccae]ANI42514.1 acyltransferase [Mycolicibacterium vaccae 95051]